jgi:hypothetical protein
MMIPAMIAAILFSIVALMTALAVLGLPLGEFTMGGQHKVLPAKFRFIGAFSFVVQIFIIVILLQAGGFIGLWFSLKVMKIICFIFAAYLSLNTLMNAASKSKKEKYVMTPLSAVTAICFWITAFTI